MVTPNELPCEDLLPCLPYPGSQGEIEDDSPEVTPNELPCLDLLPCIPYPGSPGDSHMIAGDIGALESSGSEVDCTRYPEIVSADCLSQDHPIANPVPTPAVHPDYP